MSFNCRHNVDPNIHYCTEYARLWSPKMSMYKYYEDGV